MLRFSGELHEEDLLANDSSVVVVTAAGYIKRMPLEEFTAQNRSVVDRNQIPLLVCWENVPIGEEGHISPACGP